MINFLCKAWNLGNIGNGSEIADYDNQENLYPTHKPFDLGVDLVARAKNEQFMMKQVILSPPKIPQLT